MSVMYRWTTLASGVTRDGSTVLEKYCGASRTLTELVMLDMAEDYGITMYILQTGAGSVLSHLSHFRTHVPDSWRDFFGQRRRWCAGMIVGQFNLLFVRSPFWSRRYGRCAFWLLLPALGSASRGERAGAAREVAPVPDRREAAHVNCVSTSRLFRGDFDFSQATLRPEYRANS